MARRAQIEAMLADEPGDGFLRYALALEWAAEGEFGKATATLEALIADQPDHIPAYFQAGQFLTKLGDVEKAKQMLTQGVAAARTGKDDHAAEEMLGLLATLDG